MRTTILYTNGPKLPILGVACVAFGLYGFHRTYSDIVTKNESAQARDRPLPDSASTGSALVRWTNLNGIPIPTLAAFFGISREE